MSDEESVSVDSNAKAEVEALGGWESFKSGEWFPKLVAKSFRNYYERASAEYFTAKYPGKDRAFVAGKLVSVAARNAALLGGGTGLAVSTDEIVAIATGGEGGIGLPANVAIAVTAICTEAVGLVGIQLKLVAALSRVYEVPLDPDDPEDILTIIAFAMGGSAAEAAGKVGMKVGGRITRRVIRRHLTNEVLQALKSVGRKIAMRILQRTIVKYAVPVVSVAIGGGWNYGATRAVARVAIRHFERQAAASAAASAPFAEGAQGS